MPIPFRIAYLVNRYPAVSHSFIRREIHAIEQAGTAVTRFSIRAIDSDLPDPLDQAERARTTIILDGARAMLLVACLHVLLTRPAKAIRALRCAVRAAGLSPGELVRRLAYLAEACVLVRHFAAAPVDHVHAHFGTNPAMVARLVFLLGGPPYSFTVHGPDEFDQPRQLDLRGKIADARLGVAISHFGKSQLMRWSDPDDWERIAVVRCGVDESFLMEDAPAPVPQAPHLCYVGRLSAQKGLPLLIAAAAELRRRGTAFHLTLVGDGELRPDVERLIERHGLQDAVSITGWASASDVRRHLLAARALVLPSFAEGLPVVIMEALALVRPVISTAIAGTSELLDAGCGWLIPAGSVESLVAAMESALSRTPDALEAMGREGRRRVIANHDSSVNGRALLALIRRSHGIAE